MSRRPHIGWLLKQAVDHTRRAVDEALRDHDVSVAQWAVLNRLSEHPQLSGAELARRMLITPQAAHQALTTLERMGLVQRKPDPDHARIVRAFLTEDGRRITEACRTEVLKVERRLLAGFDADERRAFTDFLVRYVRESEPPAG
jgi:DNA-binding MarR family transcriptional regulator